MAYLTGWYTPYFEVVWPHEEIGDTLSHIPDDPLVKVLGLSFRLLVTSFCGSDQTVQAVKL
jgi:hypothetical protein